MAKSNISRRLITSVSACSKTYYQAPANYYSKIYNQEIEELENVVERLNKIKRTKDNKYSSYKSMVNY